MPSVLASRSQDSRQRFLRAPKLCVSFLDSITEREQLVDITSEVYCFLAFWKPEVAIQDVGGVGYLEAFPGL